MLFEVKSVTAERAANCKTMSRLADVCSKCDACGLRGDPQVSKVVFGVGDPTADLMFVGEAPGFNEDKDGEPFTGVSGQMLRRIINQMGTSMDDIYVANILKCRPPDNRDPSPEETELCTGWLDRQVELVDPKVIVCIGRHAGAHFLSSPGRGPNLTRFSVGRYRGKMYNASGRKVIMTWHTAYALRNPAAKPEIWHDMLLVCEELGLTPLNQR